MVRATSSAVRPRACSLTTTSTSPARLFETLRAGDVLVVVNEQALGRPADEVARTIRALRRHNLVVKVLNHGAPHLEDARA